MTVISGDLLLDIGGVLCYDVFTVIKRIQSCKGGVMASGRVPTKRGKGKEPSNEKNYLNLSHVSLDLKISLF